MVSKMYLTAVCIQNLRLQQSLPARSSKDKGRVACLSTNGDLGRVSQCTLAAENGSDNGRGRSPSLCSSPGVVNGISRTRPASASREPRWYKPTGYARETGNKTGRRSFCG